MTGGEAFRSAAYGLIWAGALPLPGAAPAPPDAPADVEIALGPLPAARPGRVVGPFWRLCEDGSAWYLRDGLRALVEDGRRVLIDAPEDWSAARTGLEAAYGPPAAILHQRRAMPLHAAALASESGAALIVGAAGQGKSSLARALAAEGWRAAGDDVAVIEDGPVPALPQGLATARLFADGASAGRSAETLLGGGRGVGKAVVALPAGAPLTWPAPLRAVLFLEWVHPASARPRLTPLAPMAALGRLRAAVLRPEFVLPLGLEGVYLGRLARILSAAPAFVLGRPRRWSAMDGTTALAREAVETGAARAELQGSEP